VRTTRYHQIAEDLRERIVEGEFGAGRLLPSEAELSASYVASRVTVRRALEVLRDDALVASRQGLGWFVATDPVRQSLGRLGTIEAQLATEGVESERRILDFRFVTAPARVAAVLGPGTVLRVRRLNLAHDQPFALVTVFCPERFGAELSRADVARTSFYELMGIELGGATQSIGAAAVSAHDAELLEIPAGSPVLRCERTTRSIGGDAVLVSEHLFPAHLTEFVVDLPHVEASMAPTGLRLVE
jgi:GntR family transcriptional regulator